MNQGILQLPPPILQKTEQPLPGEERLRSLRLLKTLSLLAASAGDVPILPTILVLEPASNMEQVTTSLGSPAMIRMDYARLPPNKPLGGIPLLTLDTIKAVSGHLFQKQLYPLFHPHVDRFSNLYSVGVLVGKQSTEIQLEIVGRGFDAGDLRLGVSTPHEFVTYDLRESKIGRRNKISSPDYLRERIARAERCLRFRKYTKQVNAEGQLLSVLPAGDFDEKERQNALRLLPESYTPLSKEKLRELADFSARIQTSVLPLLPSSQIYVASFSLIPTRGWILWDIYGHWYNR